MPDEIRVITTPVEFLKWLRALPAANKPTRKMPASVEAYAQGVLMAAGEHKFLVTTPELSSYLSEHLKTDAVHVSKVERAFYQEVLKIVTPEGAIFSTTMACFILGWMLGDLEFWVNDGRGEGGLGWSTSESERVKVSVNVPVDELTMHLCLDWVQTGACAVLTALFELVGCQPHCEEATPVRVATD